MADIGKALETQGSVVVNLLLTGQEAEANGRLRRAERTLRPLRQSVSGGMAEVERLASVRTPVDGTEHAGPGRRRPASPNRSCYRVTSAH